MLCSVQAREASRQHTECPEPVLPFIALDVQCLLPLISGAPCISQAIQQQQSSSFAPNTPPVPLEQCSSRGSPSRTSISGPAHTLTQGTLHSTKPQAALPWFPASCCCCSLKAQSGSSSQMKLCMKPLPLACTQGSGKEGVCVCHTEQHQKQAAPP